MNNFFKNLFDIGIIIYLFPTVLLGFLLVLAVVWEVISMLWLVILGFFIFVILFIIFRNIREVSRIIFGIAGYCFLIGFIGIIFLLFKVTFISNEYNEIQNKLMNLFLVMAFAGLGVVAGTISNNKE